MKYKLEIKGDFEDDYVYTDQEIKEVAEDFLNENVDNGIFKIICGDGRVIEIKKEKKYESIEKN